MISYRCKSGRATAFTSFLRSCCLPHLHRSPVRKTGSFLTASPCGGFNSRAFYAELSGDMRISALKVRVLCSDPKARVYSGGVWVMPQARYVRPSAPLSDVSQDAKSEQHVRIWLSPGRMTPEARFNSVRCHLLFETPLCEPRGVLSMPL